MRFLRLRQVYALEFDKNEVKRIRQNGNYTKTAFINFSQLIKALSAKKPENMCQALNTISV